MKLKFDTTIKSERMKAFKKLAKKAGLLNGWYQFNTGEESLLTDNGKYFMKLDNQGTYGVNAYVCDWTTGNDVLFVK
jgi:hypothetical protein